MAEPFSIGAGVVGVIALTIQVSQLVIDFGLRWKDAPKDVRAFGLELESLQQTLCEMKVKLSNNPDFEDAFDGSSSALLSHLYTNDTSQSSIKEAFETCKQQLTQLLIDLKTIEKGHKLGWGRIKAAFLNKTTETIVSNLYRQCQTLDKLIVIDIAQMGATSCREIKETRKELHDWHLDTENHTILCWLARLSFEEKQSDILLKLHPGTCEWFLELDQFRDWRDAVDGAAGTLWAPGDPGAGKSVLTSRVVDHLQQYSKGENVAVRYIYCDYKDGDNQTDRSLIASLVKQSALQHGSLPDEVRALYIQCQKGENSPSLEQYKELLRSCTAAFRKTFIVVDALDEHLLSEDSGKSLQITLLKELKSIQRDTPAQILLFITSRAHLSIDTQLHEHCKIVIKANEEDVSQYVHSYIRDAGKFSFADAIDSRPDLAQDIVEKLVRNAQGMFLLPYLHLQDLSSQMSVRKVREALNDLPSDLDDTFKNAKARIESQRPQQSKVALRTLSWISRARRPLRPIEVQGALAVEPGDTKFDKDGLITFDDIVSGCAGLVHIDRMSNTMRLVHFSVEEYFKRNGHDWFPGADESLAITCLTCLTFPTDSVDELYQSENNDHSDSPLGPYEMRRAQQDWIMTQLRNSPLLWYAAHYWAVHVDCVGSPLPLGVQAASWKFLDDPKKVRTALWAIDSWESIHGDSNVRLLRRVWTPKAKMINAQTSSGFTPLNLSISVKNIDVARILLDSGASVHPASSSLTPLHRAASELWPKGLTLLLERDANPNARARHGRTALHFISCHPWTPDLATSIDAINILLNSGADINAVDRYQESPLFAAAKSNNSTVMNHLITRGADPHLTALGGITPLMVAASRFYDKRFGPSTFQSLLGLGIYDVNAADLKGRTALMWAADSLDGVDAMKILLENGAKPNLVDVDGETALMKVARRRGPTRDRLFERLIEYGADVNLVDPLDRTALTTRTQREDIRGAE